VSMGAGHADGAGMSPFTFSFSRFLDLVSYEGMESFEDVEEALGGLLSKLVSLGESFDGSRGLLAHLTLEAIVHGTACSAFALLAFRGNSLEALVKPFGERCLRPSRLNAYIEVFESSREAILYDFTLNAGRAGILRLEASLSVPREALSELLKGLGVKATLQSAPQASAGATETRRIGDVEALRVCVGILERMVASGYEDPIPTVEELDGATASLVARYGAAVLALPRGYLCLERRYDPSGRPCVRAVMVEEDREDIISACVEPQVLGGSEDLLKTALRIVGSRQ